MPYALTVGYLHLLPPEAARFDEPCTCETVRKGCSPTYVFSMMGQIGFRHSLNHLASCQKRPCRRLKTLVMGGMLAKLQWLLHEECLLGCVLIQPYLYGTRRIILRRDHFPFVAQHLATCPKESCAQLRRALLLSVRDEVRPVPVETVENY